LIESSIQGEQIKGYVIGIGINLNLDRQVIAKINQPATSLNLETGKTIDKNAFLNELIQAFFNGYESFIEKGFSIIKPEYLSRCSFLGEQITVKNLTDKQTGIAKRINDEGFLILEQNGKESVILSGDISY
jgi:BirA family biotin operon repressor/biotin-[acetyl-CoA-carboxylase] ligase